MVEAEEIFETLRVVFVLLELLDQAELLFDEGLVATRQCFEHVVDLASQGCLLACQADGLPVHVVNRAGELSDFLVSVDRYTRDFEVADLFAGADSFDGLGQSAS